MLWIAFVFFWHGLAEGQDITTLDQWLKVVAESSPQIRSEKENLKIAERNQSAAFGGLLPSLDLESSLSQDHLDRDVNEGKSSVASLGLTANLYRNHENWHDYKLAQKRLHVAKLFYVQSSGGILLKAATAYLDFSSRFVELEISKERLRLVNDQFKSSRRSYTAGTSTRLNFLRLEAEKLSAEFSVQRAQSELEKATSSLRALVSESGRIPAIKPLVFDRAFVPEVVSVDVKPENHFEYQIEDYQKQVADIEVEKARRQYWPRLDLTTRWAREVATFWGPAEESWNSDWVTTLNFSFNLFDGGIRSAAISNRRSDAIIQGNQLELVELELRDRLLKLKEDLVRTKAQVEVALRVLSIETQVFNSISSEYRVGNISYLDFINSLNKLLSARQNLQSSAAEYVSSVYAVKYNSGKMVEDVL